MSIRKREEKGALFQAEEIVCGGGGGVEHRPRMHGEQPTITFS